MEAARRLDRATHRRGSGLHGGFIGRNGIAVLWTLLYRGWGKAGACDPSVMQIAIEAQCARSTVQLALRRLEAANVLWSIQRGHVRDGRWEQVTNVYLFLGTDTWRSDTDLRAPLESLLKEKMLWKGAGEVAHPEIEPGSLRHRTEWAAVAEAALSAPYVQPQDDPPLSDEPYDMKRVTGKIEVDIEFIRTPAQQIADTMAWAERKRLMR